MKPYQQIAPQWLTIEGATRYSGLSDGTIRTYIREGHIVSANIVLPGNRRGRRLINRPRLDAFIESYVVGTKREADQQQRALLNVLSTAADAISEARRIAAGVREQNESDFPSII
jgi:hypothetical protein